MLLYGLYPGGAGSHLLEVEEMGVEYLVEVHVTIVGVDDLGLGLQCAHYLAQTAQFVGSHLAGLVEQHNVAELYLLDDQVLDVLLLDVLLGERQAALELILHAQGVDDGDDAVEHGVAVDGDLGGHARYGADGLCDGCGLADAAGLNDDVVEAVHAYDVLQLLHEVHLQRAAYTSVLQRHQRVVLLVDHASLLYEVGVDVDLSDVIDDDGKLDASFVTQYSVQQCCLAAAQVSCQQQYWCTFHNYQLSIINYQLSIQQSSTLLMSCSFSQ